MSIITFEIPIIEKDCRKPVTIANQSYPYNQIANHRRFEELLYSICKAKIETVGLREFDSVSLMTGVRDKGRDCALFKDGKSYGLVQCKKYDKNYNKEDFGLEIIKFALYSLLDDGLIHDKSDFTYYIAVSTGFTAGCSQFIDDFNNIVLTEPQLSYWIAKNLEVPTLTPLKLTCITTEVISILSRLRVVKITPQDIDVDLSSPFCSKLIPLFFEVRTVIDNSKIDQLIKTFEGELTETDITRQLRIGSASLQSERNTFEGINHSHIRRAETTELLNWILEDTEKNKQGDPLNICLLAGQAGYGKTVILKDLYTECIAQNIPVLGLKADKLYSYTISDLQKSVGISLPIYDFFEECKKHFLKMVILIDQIDALSQSMSSDRSYLNVFRSFIDNFANDESIKIIISVRIQDLHYDPSLRIYKNIKTFEVKRLTESQVIEQVAKIGISKENLSVKLLELLRTPNHLNIFSRIATNNENSLRATSIQDLYFELWNKKVLEISNIIPVEKHKVKQVIYNIANRMFSTQRITVSEYQFEDFTDELRYLESEWLIKIEDKQLQFFHQSFYDFVFAKQYIETGRDLLEYIKECEQSIHIRSAIKMMISYLRDFNPQQYIKVLTQIFADHEILFHIKHILFSTVLSQVQPTKQEIKFTSNVIHQSFHFGVVFFEQANAKTWFNVAKENSLFDLLKPGKEDILLNDQENIQTKYIIYRKNACFNFLKKFVARDNDVDAWEFLKSIEDQVIIKNLLFSVEKWDNPLAYELLEKCDDFEETDPFGYYHVLDNIAKTNPEFALTQLSKVLPLHYKITHSDRDYEEQDVLKTLAKSSPHKLFPILFDAMKVDFDREVEDDQIFIWDYRYNYVDLQDTESLSGSEFLYQLLGVCVKRSAKKHQDSFLTFFDDHKRSRYHIILRLLLFSLADNEKQYAKQVFELFCYFNECNLLTYCNDIQYDLRVTFENAFPHLKKEQKNFALNTIKGYRDKKEIFYRKATATEKRMFSSKWGLSKYYWLLRLPTETINTDTELKRLFHELQRKFTKYVDKPRKRTVLAGAVSSPIPTTAYQFMTKEQWLKSFRKYDGDRDRFGDNFLKGGLDELAIAFQNNVKENPTNTKLEIIQAAIDDSSVNIKYAVYGLWGWVEAKANPKQAVPLFKKILYRNYPSNNYPSNNSITIMIARRLIGNETDDPDLVNFIVNDALDYGVGNENQFVMEEDKETSINGLITRGINTAYGSAAHSLVYIQDPNYKELVFQTAEIILSQGPREARAALLWEFAYLLNLDKIKTFELFSSSLNSEEDPHVIASSIWSLQYMTSYGLAKLTPAYVKLIDSKMLGREDSHSLFTVLYGSYLHNQNGASELLYKLLASNKYSRSGAINDVMKYYYQVADSKEKNDKLLNYVLDKATEEDFETLNWSFIHAEHLKLGDIYNFLKKYIQSPFFKITEYFIDYLILQCSHSPFKAIELFDLALENDQFKTDERSGLRSDEAALKFIVGAYDALSENDETSKTERKKLLNAFDKVLKDYRFRKDTERVLEELV